MPGYEPNPDGSLRQLPAPDAYRLSGLREKVKAHWKEFSPKAYRELLQAGKLERELDLAVEETKDTYRQGVESGLAADQAWEIAREHWLNRLPMSED